MTKKKQNGITLIALVITIVVLLILAGVSIMTLTGDNGLLTRTTTAKQKTEEAGVIENIRLAYQSAKIGEYAENGKTFNQLFLEDLQKTYSGASLNASGNEVTIDGVIYEIDSNGNASKKRKTLSIGNFQIVDENGSAISGKISSGTTAYVRFTVSEGTDIVVKDSSGTTIEKDGNYYKKAITENGTYSFTVTGKVEGENVTLTPSTTVSSFSNIPTGLAVGKKIKYEPTGTYNWNAEYATSYTSGTTDYTNASKTLQTVATGSSISTGNQDMSIRLWKVLSIDESTETIKMVPAELDNSSNATNKVTLHGAQGYNNAVTLLDEACSALYSDSDNGITSESIDIDDIEKIMDDAKVDDNEDNTYDWLAAKQGYSGYGSQQEEPYTVANSKYPVIYAEEKSRAIGSTYTPSTTGLDLSEKPVRIENNVDTGKIKRNEGTSTTEYIGAINSSSTQIKPQKTYYYFSNSDFSKYLGTTYSGILLPNDATTKYWVASRCVITDSGSCYFNVRYVGSGRLGAGDVFNSSGRGNAPAYALFPVVSLSSGLLANAPNGANGYDFYVE